MHFLELSEHLLQLPFLRIQLLFLVLEAHFEFLELLFFLLEFKLLLAELLLAILLSFLAQADAHIWQIKQILDVWALIGVGLYHPLNYAHELLRVVVWDAFKLPIPDLEREGQVVVGHERRAELRHLVNNNSERPNMILLSNQGLPSFW